MSKHVVIKAFIDKETKDRYSIDDVYMSTNEKRISFLKEEGFLEPDHQENKEFPKHVGGGWYQLSDGEKIQGKKEAQEAEQELNKEGE